MVRALKDNKMVCNDFELFIPPAFLLFQLSFPLVGTLHGAHMFAANQGAGQLVSTVTERTKVAWKVYEDRYSTARHDGALHLLRS